MDLACRSRTERGEEWQVPVTDRPRVASKHKYKGEAREETVGCKIPAIINMSKRSSGVYDIILMWSWYFMLHQENVCSIISPPY